MKKKKRKKEKRKSQAVDQRDNPWTKRLLELVEKYVCYEHEIHFLWHKENENGVQEWYPFQKLPIFLPEIELIYTLLEEN